MLREVGYCNGLKITRVIFGEASWEPPDTLLSYFLASASPTSPDLRSTQPPGFLTVIDESHVTIPQLRAMYAGDQARKKSLVEHGFRLPSARDNRPLTFAEFEARIGSVLLHPRLRRL